MITLRSEFRRPGSFRRRVGQSRSGNCATASSSKVGPHDFFELGPLKQNVSGLLRPKRSRARIDERTKREASAALNNIGLTVPDAFRLLLVRVAAEKALPFEPLNPNVETVAARREIRYTTRFKRDYRREKSGRHSKKLDIR